MDQLTVSPSDLAAAAAGLRRLARDLGPAASAALGAERTAAAHASPGAAAALMQHAETVQRAMGVCVDDLDTLAAALETAGAELLSQDVGMLGAAG